MQLSERLSHVSRQLIAPEVVQTELSSSRRAEVWQHVQDQFAKHPALVCNDDQTIVHEQSFASMVDPHFADVFFQPDELVKGSPADEAYFQRLKQISQVRNGLTELSTNYLTGLVRSGHFTDGDPTYSSRFELSATFLRWLATHQSSDHRYPTPALRDVMWETAIEASRPANTLAVSDFNLKYTLPLIDRIDPELCQTLLNDSAFPNNCLLDTAIHIFLSKGQPDFRPVSLPSQAREALLLGIRPAQEWGGQYFPETRQILSHYEQTPWTLAELASRRNWELFLATLGGTLSVQLALQSGNWLAGISGIAVSAGTFWLLNQQAALRQHFLQFFDAQRENVITHEVVHDALRSIRVDDQLNMIIVKSGFNERFHAYETAAEMQKQVA